MSIGKEARGLRRHDTAHRLPGDLDDMHIGAARDRDRSEFETDEAGADNNDLACFVQPVSQDVRIGQGPQWEYAVELGPGHGKQSATRSGREHQMIPRNLTARAQPEPPVVAIYPRNRLAVEELDLVA